MPTAVAPWRVGLAVAAQQDRRRFKDSLTADPVIACIEAVGRGVVSDDGTIALNTSTG